MNYEAEIN